MLLTSSQSLGLTQRLAGKSTLITAAGQGIGKAIAERFLAEGASVVATDVSERSLQALAEKCPGIQTVQLDVLDSVAIGTCADGLRHINVLVNCAGMVKDGNILDCSENDWQESMSLNLTSMYRVTKAFLPGMLSSGRGSILNVASVASSIRGVPNRFAYGVTKAGVIGLTKSVAADFVAQGIRCNAICPGTISTPSLEDRMRSHGNYEEAHAAFVARQPMGRLGTPDEVAALAAYLASDESAFTTGAIHIIDGGWCM